MSTDIILTKHQKKIRKVILNEILLTLLLILYIILATFNPNTIKSINEIIDNKAPGITYNIYSACDVSLVRDYVVNMQQYLKKFLNAIENNSFVKLSDSEYNPENINLDKYTDLYEFSPVDESMVFRIEKSLIKDLNINKNEIKNIKKNRKSEMAENGKEKIEENTNQNEPEKIDVVVEDTVPKINSKNKNEKNSKGNSDEFTQNNIMEQINTDIIEQKIPPKLDSNIIINNSNNKESNNIMRPETKITLILN